MLNLLIGNAIFKIRVLAMREISDAYLYQKVGSAVVSAQMFERSFIIAARFAVKQHDAKTIEDIVPVNESKALKQAVTALLKEIAGGESISELEVRIATLVEDRHRIVHRLGMETGWPGTINTEQREMISLLCDRVCAESNAVTAILLELMYKWVDKFPKLREGLTKEFNFGQSKTEV